MGLGSVFKAVRAASKIADKPKKTKSAMKVNMGKSQTKTTPAGVSKKTPAVKREEKTTSGKSKKEGQRALDAKAARSKRAMKDEMSARKKGGSYSNPDRYEYTLRTSKVKGKK